MSTHALSGLIVMRSVALSAALLGCTTAGPAALRLRHRTGRLAQGRAAFALPAAIRAGPGERSFLGQRGDGAARAQTGVGHRAARA